MTLTTWQGGNACGAAACGQTNTVADELNQLLAAFAAPFEAPAFWSPAVDLYQTPEAITVKAELPGLKKENIAITLQDGWLTLSGERQVQRDGATEIASESPRGRFQRALRLPSEVDAKAIKASYTDGILTVELPKAEAAKPKQIKIEFN